MKKILNKNICINSVNNFIGNDDTIEQIDNIFKKKKSEQIIYIKGTYGTGKTLISKLFFNKYNYYTHHIYLSNNKTKKFILNFLENIENSSNILSFFISKEKKFGLIIDELEILNTNEQHIVKLLLEYIKKTNTPTIFISDFICNSNIDKLLKSVSQTFELESPSSSNFYIFIKKNYNNLIIKKEFIKNIILHYNHDVRKILYTINEIYLMSNNEINKKLIDTILKVNDTYNSNSEIKKTIKNVFEKECSIENMIYQYSKKKQLLIDFVMYNCIEYINLYCKNYKDSIYCLEQLSKYYLDILNFDENFCFFDSEIITQYCGIFFYYMIYYIFLYIKKRKRSYDIKYPLNNIKKYHFYKKKNTLSIIKKNTTLNITNIIYIKNILVYLITNNNDIEICEILKNFNISYKYFLLIINYENEIKINNKLKKKLYNIVYE